VTDPVPPGAGSGEGPGAPAMAQARAATDVASGRTDGSAEGPPYGAGRQGEATGSERDAPHEAVSRSGTDPATAPEPAFEAPWHAQAFALTVALVEQGVFDWATWAQALGAELAQRPGADGGDDYFNAWMAALETLLATRDPGVVTALPDVQAAWAQAYRDTPHGAPVALPEALLSGLRVD